MLNPLPSGGGGGETDAGTVDLAPKSGESLEEGHYLRP